MLHKINSSQQGRMLSTNSFRPKLRYRQLNHEVNKCFKVDRSAWVDKKALELEAASRRNDTRAKYKLVSVLSGKKQCITNSSVKSKDGIILKSGQERLDRWK